jgi:DNA-binding CsgD family transcriptional regulator
MTSARIPSDFSAQGQLRFPFCSCGATVLTIEKTATCTKCGHTLVREGMHVKVGPIGPDGKPHPHAGKTGRITKCINIYSDPPWLGSPSAMVELDSGIKPRGFIWVSLASSEVLSSRHDEARQKKFGLTPRELELISAVVAGYSNKKIAEYFKISEDTVKYHLGNIVHKIDVSTRLELALFAINQGLPLKNIE